MRARIGSLLSGPGGRILVARVVALAAGLLTVVASAGALGPDGRGVLATFAVLQFIAATGLGFGTGSAAYVEATREGATPRNLPGELVGWCVVVGLGSAALVGLAAVAGSWSVWFVEAPLPTALALVVGCMGMYATTALTQVAMGRARSTITAIGFAAAPILIAVGTLGAAVLQAAPIYFIGVQASGWLLAAILISTLLTGAPLPRPRNPAQLSRLGAKAAPGDIANALSYRLDLLILAAISGSAAAGVYSLAVQALEPVWILATVAVSTLLIALPRTPPPMWIPLARRYAFWVVTLTTLAALAVTTLLTLAISELDPRFERSVALAWVLLPGIAFLSASKVLAAFQVAAGRLWIGSGIATVSLLVTTSLDLLLIPRIDAMGAAIASTVGYGASAVLWLWAMSAYPAPATASDPA